MSQENFQEVVKFYIEVIVDFEKYHLGNWKLDVHFKKLQWSIKGPCTFGKCFPYKREIYFNNKLPQLISISGPEIALERIWDTMLHEIAHLSNTPRQWENTTPKLNKALSDAVGKHVDENHNLYFWKYHQKLHKKYDYLFKNFSEQILEDYKK